jgi:ABC transporter with metal-binding/Fe-S-binding domain ATP-binding protein
MKLAVLFSGGKDSCYALQLATKQHEVACLLTIESENPESFMFHTPNINLTRLQAEAMGLPILTKTTPGEKEEELKDLKELIEKAKEEYTIKGVVTGAIESVYQATRVQKICDELGLWCFNPLWQKDQVELLNELLENKFQTLIIGVFGFPLDESFLGKYIDKAMIQRLLTLKEKFQINPSGEGGELETFVTNAPMFNKAVIVKKSKVEYSNNAGIYLINGAELE